jgi:hypothetical protein
MSSHSPQLLFLTHLTTTTINWLIFCNHLHAIGNYQETQMTTPGAPDYNWTSINEMPTEPQTLSARPLKSLL